MKKIEGASLASFRARTIAILLDCFIVLLLLLISDLGVMYVLHSSASHNVNFKFDLPSGYGVVIDGKKIKWMSYVIEFGVPVFYWGLLTYFWNGRTLGKWIAGIRVVSTNHEKIGLWQSIERALGYSISALEKREWASYNILFLDVVL